MAELVDGTFVFTVLDHENTIYFVRGENPLCIYHYQKLGLYVYASTEAILMQALKQARFIHGEAESVATEQGDILRINEDGSRDKSTFNSPYLMEDSCCYGVPYLWTSRFRDYGLQFVEEKNLKEMDTEESKYYRELLHFAGLQGYLLVDRLIEEGFSLDEIEDYLYSGYYQ